jgi:PKD repeat protein
VDTFELTVTVHPQFEVNVAISEDSFCAGDSIEIAAIASGPANDVYLQWTGSGGSQVENSPFVYVSDSIGGQTIHAFAVDALHGCQASDSLEVVVHAPLTLVLEPSITSGCSPLELNVENETEGVGIWNWVYGSTGLSSSEFQPNFTLIQTGSDAEIQNIVVSVVSEWGCESSDSISIEVLPRPELDFSFEDSLLCGIPAQTIPVVTSPADLQLGWFINGTLVSANESPVLQFDELGQQVIELTGSNSFGCSSFSLDSLEVSATPQVGLSAAPLMGCAPHLLEIEHETLGAAEWSIEIAMDSFLVFETDEPIEEILLEVPGMYGLTLTAVSEFGCEAIATLTDSVTVLPRPTVGFLPDPYAGSFDSPHPLNSSWTFENTSDFGQSIWDFGDGELSSEWDASHTYDASGTYEVLLTVINDFGCAQEFMMMVDVQENLEVYVPNAFTPPEQGYADGINDGWRPVLSDPDLVDRYELIVYNRYGQLVWSTQDKDAYWVGEARNGGAYFAPGGIYTWVLQIDSNSFAESSRQWKGQVTLLR